MKPKASSKDYSAAAFFMEEEYQDGKRLVAWTADLAQMRNLILCLIDPFPAQLEVLYKVRKKSEAEEEEWQRYYGAIEKENLQHILQSQNKWVFHDGDSQFCVRRADTGEYIAFDDHGILFIYSDDGESRRILSEQGFEERDALLIMETGHWHHIPGGEKERESFVREIGIEEVR